MIKERARVMAKDGKGDTGKGASPKNPNLQLPVSKSGERPDKCVRISEEPDVQEDSNSQNSSNKMPEGGAMNDSSKRRHEAMVQTASDSEDEGSYSVVTCTSDSPLWFAFNFQVERRLGASDGRD